MGNAPHKILQGGQDDMPIDVSKTPYYTQVAKRKEDMNGMERLKALFDNENGVYTPEMTACGEAMFLSMLASGLFGGFARSRVAYQDFFRTYAHHTFETPMRARMLLQEKVVVAFGTGFWRVGWRVSLFAGMFMIITTCVTAYRGKYGPISIGIGGATAGMLYKFREGPKATLAGGVVGAGLGLIAGALTLAAFKATGTSYDEIISTEYQRRALEIEKTIQGMHEAREEVDRAHSLSEFQDALVNEKPGASSPSPSQTNQKAVDVKVVPSPSESQKNATVVNLALGKQESKA